MERNTIRVRVADGILIDWYSTSDATEKQIDARFAADGQALIVTFERTSVEPHAAVVARFTAPGERVDVATFEMIDGGFHPAIDRLSPDDASFVLEYWTDAGNNSVDFHLSPALFSDGTTVPLPEGRFLGYVPGRLAESWPVSIAPSVAP